LVAYEEADEDTENNCESEREDRIATEGSKIDGIETDEHCSTDGCDIGAIGYFGASFRSFFTECEEGLNAICGGEGDEKEGLIGEGMFYALFKEGLKSGRSDRLE
jgi:hypothetical protein